jgi:hypothetical protein
VVEGLLTMLAELVPVGQEAATMAAAAGGPSGAAE